jgi:hypothetical protein
MAKTRASRKAANETSQLSKNSGANPLPSLAIKLPPLEDIYKKIQSGDRSDI